MSRVWNWILFSMWVFLPVCIFAQPTWRLASGTAGNPVVGVDVFRSNPDTMYALCKNNFLRSTNRGENWDSISYVWAAVGAIGVHPTNSQTLFVSVPGLRVPVGNDPLRSTDGGRTWSYPLFFGSLYAVKVIEFDPVETGTIYIGVGPFTTVHRSSNNGETWETLGHLSNSVYLNSFSIARSNNNILYEGYLRGVAKSTDRGISWTTLSFGFLPSNIVLVSVDPRDADVAYAAVWTNNTDPGGMFKTTNGGISWSEINNGIGLQDRQVKVLVINPKNPDELFLGIAGTQHILLRTTNAGKDWNYFDEGMSGLGGVNSIAFDTLNNRVYAGISSASVPGLYIHEQVTGVSPNLLSPGYFQLSQNYPNPFNPTTAIKYQLPASGFVSLKVYDILGREAAILVNQVMTPGVHEATFDANGLTSGVYLYRLQVGTFNDVKKLLLLK